MERQPRVPYKNSLVSDSTQQRVLMVTGPGKYEIYPFRSAVVEWLTRETSSLLARFHLTYSGDELLTSKVSSDLLGRRALYEQGFD